MKQCCELMQAQADQIYPDHPDSSDCPDHLVAFGRTCRPAGRQACGCTMEAKKYVQSHTLDTPLNEGLRASREMLAEYDGVAEVWFESEEAPVEGMSSPEGQQLGAALLKDERNFIDHSKSSAFIVEEIEF